MIRYYPPILMLQMFCFYHVYTHTKDYKWYMIVTFLPLVGSLLYLYVHFMTNTNIDAVADIMQNTFTTDPKLKKLISELEFADTLTNRLNLADAHLLRGNSAAAVEQYEICLANSHKPDPFVQSKLMEAYYLEEDYTKVVIIGKGLEKDKDFKKSTERISYALALQHTGQVSLAESEFESMDVQYSNYDQRLSYAEFLHSIGKIDEADSKLEELLEEVSKMDRREKRYKAEIIRDINFVSNRGF